MVHTDTGWPGRKTISVSGGSGLLPCSGPASAEVVVMTPNKTPIVGIAFAFGTRQGFGVAACTPLGGFPPLRPGSRLEVVQNLDDRGEPWMKIDFGCAAGGCVYGAAGEPDSVAPPTYPSPGTAQYALFMRVGNERKASGQSAALVLDPATVEAPAPVEFCVNDDAPADDYGGWSLSALVREAP